jgi:hypothetical protein
MMQTHKKFFPLLDSVNTNKHLKVLQGLQARYQDPIKSGSIPTLKKMLTTDIVKCERALLHLIICAVHHRKS